MKETVTKSRFMDAFYKAGRYNAFSYDGLSALFDFFEEMEEDTGVEIELDVIAICCDYTQYDNFENLQEDHDIESIEKLKDKTTVIEFKKGLIIQNY